MRKLLATTLGALLLVVMVQSMSEASCTGPYYGECNCPTVTCYDGNTTASGPAQYYVEVNSYNFDPITCTATLEPYPYTWSGNDFIGAAHLGPNQTIVGDKLQWEYNAFAAQCGLMLVESFERWIYYVNELAARPVNRMGLPDDAKTTGCNNGEGAPVWFVNKVNMNLYVTDTPIWYKPAYGPSVQLKLSYNSQATVDATAPFGNKWTFNYGSYISIGVNNTVTVSMPDGRQDIYMNPNSQGIYATKPMGVFNTLTQVSNSIYTLAFLDGTVYTYDILASGSQTASLSKITDAYGQSLTLGYQNNKLISITDAVGNSTTTFTYASNKVVVTDPFNRTAVFTFDSSNNLISATDMGGYVTTYTYDTSGHSYLASITDPKGTWDFLIEPSDSATSADPYPAVGVGAPMGQNYRITITDPLGHQEEYYYNGAYSWYVSPAAYVPYQNINNNNMSLAQKTQYWLDTSNAQYGRIGSQVSPEGQSTTYQYDDTAESSPIPNYIYANTGAIASVTDGDNHTRTYQYNTNGLIINYWDAMTPITSPATLAYRYAANNIDVTSVTTNSSVPSNTTQPLGTVTYTYNGATHDIASMTDRLGYITDFNYNSTGQLTSVVEAATTSLATTTTLNYDSNAHTLSNIAIAGLVVKSFTYDNIGRISSATYADGVTIDYAYAGLNQTQTITYPDQKTVQIANDTSCPYLVDSITDRAGLTTNFTYDALKRLTLKQGPDGTFSYIYDPNSNLTSFVDASNNTTAFGYDLDNRLASKTYAGTTTSIYYTYDPAGLLATFTNGRHQTVTYGHDANNNLTSISYSDGVTPNVTMTYDAYNRLATRTDSVGQFAFAYDNDSRLTSVAYPWDNGNPTVQYAYDALNRIITITPSGGTPVAYGYNDPLGRLQAITKGSNTFTYSYVGNSSLINNLSRPGGGTTQYLYNDPLMKLTSVINMNPTSSIFSEYDYTYNNLDLRATETITNGLAITNFVAGTTNYTANQLNQFTSSTNPTVTYAYDNDGNMTNAVTPAGYAMNLAYDEENRLTSASYTDNQSLSHLTNYYYTGDSLLAEIKKTVHGTVTSDTRYIRAGFLPIEERNTSNGVTREYLWGNNIGGGIGGLLSMLQNSINYNYLYDGKGNVTSLMDANQNVDAAYAYDPFGVPMETSLAQGFTDQPFKFSTKQYDSDTGLYYFGYRFYTPNLGRWINRDPLGEAGDVNLYRYVQNNPVNYVDPIGLVSLVTDMTGGTTTFDPRPEDPSGVPLTITTSNAVDRLRSLPGAQDPYTTPDVTPRSDIESPAYGPLGAYIDTGDTRGRVIHGGGSSLPDPYQPRQKLKPTLGCTRGHNEDVQELNRRIGDFKARHPGVPVPYTRW